MKNLIYKWKNLCLYSLLIILVLGLPNLSLFGQERKTVFGKVTDEVGMPISGVNIILKGAMVQSSTDSAGNYAIEVQGTNPILVFSSVGFLPQEYPVVNASKIDIRMTTDIAALDEVIVVGYGTQRKRDLTGAISQIKGESIKNQPHANMASLFSGRLSGIQVTTNSGTPGGSVTLRIRGNTSLNSGNDPLYVIDGIPTEDITAFNANDIESIEILKDASASAIYGARAANGVVLITTKRGVAGETAFSFNAYSGIQEVAKRIPMMNAQQQYDYVVKGTENYNRIYPETPMVIRPSTLEDFGAGYDTDWQDEIFRLAPMQNYDLGINGGSEKARFSVGLNYYDQDGVIISSGYKRINGRFNIDADLSDRIRLGASLIASREIRDRVPENDSPESVLGNALRKLAYEPVYEPDGSYAIRERPNPVAQANETYDFGYSTKLLGSAYLEADLLEGLTFRTFIAVDQRSYRDDFFKPSFILGGTNRPATASGGENSSWLSENTLSYKYKINDTHNFLILAGASFQENKSYSHRARGSLGATDIIPTLNASAQRDEVFSNITSWGIASLFGRINYAMKDRYLLTFNLRQDGSSRFGKDNKYAIFPAGSIGWRISEEPFFQNVPFVNDFKIRGSYGRTGNQSIGNFVAQGVYNTGANYAGDPGVSIGGIPVNNLSWETTDQSDIGLDVELFNSRLTFNFDYYNKKTTGLLFSVPLPSTTGFGSTLQNLGEIENKGIEMILSGRIIQEKAFNWSSDFNISFNKNKVVSLPGGNSLINSYSTGTYYSVNASYITQEGAPIGAFYGYKWTGEVYPTEEAAKEHVSTIIGREPLAGTIKYEDISGTKGVPDGKIDANDRQIIGSPHPDFSGGFNNTFQYRDFDLSVLCQFVYGNDIFNQNRTSSDRGFIYNAATTDMIDAWGEPGQITKRHKAFSVSDEMDNQFSSVWIEDGSYFRIKNVTLGYNLSSSFLSKWKIRRARIYLTAQNLFTFTDYKGFDPEVNSMTGNVRTLGVDIGAFPQVRTYMAGINLSF